jgi:hypothetical protein
MTESLPALEQQREFILQQILRLPDFRSGSITATRAPCGKPSCHCHQPHHPGHGPNYRLTRKVDGKTVTETFATPLQLRKAQQEVEAYHRCRQLSAELLEVNEKICPLRPLAGSLSSQEKKRQKRSSKKSRAK